MKIEQLADGRYRCWMFAEQPDNVELFFDSLEGIKGFIENASRKFKKYAETQIGVENTFYILVIQQGPKSEEYGRFVKEYNDMNVSIDEFIEYVKSKRKEVSRR